MIRAILATAGIVVGVTPVLAVGQPVIWRDPNTGCGYYLTPQGGMTIRYRADGTIDCRDVPAAGAAAGGRLDDMGKELGRGLDTLLRRGPEERL
jgi:hypothetical protein